MNRNLTEGLAQATRQMGTTAAEQAGSLDRAKVLKAMKKGKFKTVLGELSFDKKGDVSLPGYVFYEWSNGNYKQL